MDPAAAVTDATFTGSGPWTIVLTVSNGLAASSCMMTVIGSATPVPGEVSATAPYLHVAKVVSPAAAILLRCAAPADPGMTLNFYAGSLLRSRIVAYDHAPLVCATTGTPAGPGVTEFTAPYDAGVSHYYLVSASSCAGEGTRGFRSDGVERPSLSTDCGP